MAPSEGVELRAALDQPRPVGRHQADPPCIGRLTHRDFGQLARSIGYWTTNLLASAIVLAAGLAMGWQVLAWWRDTAGIAPPADARARIADMVPGAEGREFWTSRGPVRVERIRGDAEAAAEAMREFCRASAGQPRDWLAKAGPGEERYVARLREQQPLEQVGGAALYEPTGQTGMVVGLDRAAQRIAAWSFALPVEQGAWVIYHFQPGAVTPASASAPQRETKP